jgi:CHAT domain-containing protein/tetratricopeptide (TPR) repeat protein
MSNKQPLAAWVVLGALAALVAPSSARAGSDGVVVEEVTPGFGGEKSGLKVGDVLLAWSREASPPASPKPAHGKIRTPFDLVEPEYEQAPRGHVTLTGSRGGVSKRWVASPEEWRIRARPALDGKLLRLYLDAKQRAGSSPAEALPLWQELAGLDHTHRERAAWFLFNGAKLAADTKLADGWDRLYLQALELLQSPKPKPIAAWVLYYFGRSLAYHDRWDEGLERCRRAVDLCRQRGGSELKTATLLTFVGQFEVVRGRIDTANRDFEQALALQQASAPESLPMAYSLERLSRMTMLQGDPRSALAPLQHAIAIEERLAPRSLAWSASMSDLGDIFRWLGDLATAEQYLRSALAVDLAFAPGELKTAHDLVNLGLLALARGDLAAAEDFLQRSYVLVDGYPSRLLPVDVLDHLGRVAAARHDLDVAESYYRRALEMQEKTMPDDRAGVAKALRGLGDVALARGNTAGAQAYFRRAIGVDRRQAPMVQQVDELDGLAAALVEAESLDAAEDAVRRRFEITNESAESSSDFIALGTLARIASARGDSDLAEKRARSAVVMVEARAPGTVQDAEALRDLARVQLAKGDRAAAAVSLTKAVDALEAQRGRLGGSEETRGSFADAYAGCYREAVEVLVELGRNAEAFHTLERSRARSLLAMLAVRDLQFPADLPPELVHEQRVNQAAYDRAQADLLRLMPDKDAPEIERLQGRLRELRDQNEQLATRIRQASPHFASIHYPQPLDSAGARAALEPGTALVAYSVGDEGTTLFVLRPDADLSVFTLPVAAAALREKIQSFRRAIAGSSDVRRLDAEAVALYDLLLHPAEALLASSERLVISPDGPLHVLPFAALERQKTGGPYPKRQYLAEWKPLHTVASATVYAELKKARHDRQEQHLTVAAFGDPHYPPQPQTESNPELRLALKRGLTLSPLPASRKEVEAIASLYGAQAQTYVGEEATEQRVKAVASDARLLHFACHALIDEGLPLNSALALSIPDNPKEGEDNGLLQAWEIFDSLRLDADLVTLSACDTALGKDMGGEGLMGLTRAFQYAGARSVLASLWSVSDESTADLMARFYGYLKNGKTKDEALQAAQMDLIRTNGPYAHPFHWAAFQLFGDWK